MPAAGILDFFRSLSQGKQSQQPNCITVPDFVKIGQTAAEIWLFSIFHNGGCRHLGLLKFQIFNGRYGQEVELHQHAKFCQNWLNRGRHMAIFRFSKMAAAAILDF